MERAAFRQRDHEGTAGAYQRIMKSRERERPSASTSSRPPPPSSPALNSRGVSSKSTRLSPPSSPAMNSRMGASPTFSTAPNSRRSPPPASSPALNSTMVSLVSRTRTPLRTGTPGRCSGSRSRSRSRGRVSSSHGPSNNVCIRLDPGNGKQQTYTREVMHVRRKNDVTVRKHETTVVSVQPTKRMRTDPDAGVNLRGSNNEVYKWLMDSSRKPESPEQRRCHCHGMSTHPSSCSFSQMEPEYLQQASFKENPGNRSNIVPKPNNASFKEERGFMGRPIAGRPPLEEKFSWNEFGRDREMFNDDDYERRRAPLSAGRHGESFRPSTERPVADKTFVKHERPVRVRRDAPMKPTNTKVQENEWGIVSTTLRAAFWFILIAALVKWISGEK